METFSQLEAFTEVVAQGSFSRAAERLGVKPSSVSRAVASLEASLGVRLLNRTTHSLSVTHEGAAYHARALAILADVQDAARSVSRSRATPRGRLRVDAPLALGEQLLAPALPELLRRYPELSVDLSLRDTYVDPISEGIDVTLRMGKLRASELTARKLGRVRIVVAGSPAYLARYGRPRTPDELSGHKGLLYLLRVTRFRGAFVRRRARRSRRRSRASWSRRAARCCGARRSPARGSRACSSTAWPPTSHPAPSRWCWPSTSCRRCPCTRCTRKHGSRHRRSARSSTS